MSEHTKEPWVAHLFEGGGFTINVSADPDMPPVICARNDWSYRSRESHDNATRIVQCVNACAGLTSKQVAALPRLVEWFTTPPGQMNLYTPEFMDDLNRIFPDREAP